MKKIFKEIIGWYGAGAVLVAYIFLGLNILSSTNILYIFLNFTGALGLLFISIKKKIYLISLFYLIWAIISLSSFIKF